MLKSITVLNLLSFGPTLNSLDLGPLNVLIGPNGSGKSNLIEMLALLRAAPRDLAAPVREGGGIREWLWRGTWKGSGPPEGSLLPFAIVNAILAQTSGYDSIEHEMRIAAAGERLHLINERVESELPLSGLPDSTLYFGYENGLPTFNVNRGNKRILKKEAIDPEQSILSQRRDPEMYPEVTFVGDAYSKIRLYRDWNVGRNAPARLPQRTDLQNESLLEDASNLALILNRLRQNSKTKQALLSYFKELYPATEDVDVNLNGGTVQVTLQERGWTLPATRFSDGMVRWLCLLAVLLDNTTSAGGNRRLICIEEPEIGLHPDLMPTLARLLREASQKNQIIVTTHSDALVDALTDQPESVVVCEKQNGATVLKRLNATALAEWLEKYSLGQLWKKGEIGGNRW